MHNIAIRTDGGPYIGIGHIMRCLTLAEALRRLNCNVIFISNAEYDIIKRKGFYIKCLGENGEESLMQKKYEDIMGELSVLKNLIKDLKIDCIIIDHYSANNNYLKELRKFVKLIVYFDDFCNNIKHADIIINGNVYANKNCYPSFENKNLIIGPKYTLLRDEFVKVEKRNISKIPKQIMITTGGNDEFGLTKRFVKLLKQCEELSYLKIVCVIGQMFDDKDFFEIASKNYPEIEILKNISNMANIMVNSDLALTTSGSTLYELCATGTPSISFIIAENQEKLAMKMSKMDCTVNMGWYNNVSDSQIQQEIIDMIVNYERRKKMSKIGQQMFDGKGSHRCAKKIIENLTFKNK